MAHVEYVIARQRGDIPKLKLQIDNLNPHTTLSKDEIVERLDYGFNPDESGWSASIFYGKKRGSHVEMSVGLDTKLARCGTIYKHGHTKSIGFDPVLERHSILFVSAQESVRRKYSGFSGVSALYEGTDLTGGVSLRLPVEKALLKAVSRWDVAYSSELKGQFVCFEDPAMIRIHILIDEELRYRNYWVELPAFRMNVRNDQGRSATVTIPAVEER